MVRKTSANLHADDICTEVSEEDYTHGIRNIGSQESGTILHTLMRPPIEGYP
ncbi:hypothetical protein C8J55DRAFT_506216 [Lentinula edodes]|uniref:Uncharacterized protein n=1 Tax=Lentinula lateritia TaxID=40482 RepID=A0A9W9AT23_9AGAR|nr:hypothetical protein C8J55DRAFT_506216 [Lentinula edodes]